MQDLLMIVAAVFTAFVGLLTLAYMNLPQEKKEFLSRFILGIQTLFGGGVFDTIDDPENPDWLLVHGGKFGRSQLLFARDCSNLVLCKPNPDCPKEPIQDRFRRGLRTGLELYPIVRGKLYRTRDHKLWVKRGVVPADPDQFLTVTDLSKDDSLPSFEGKTEHEIFEILTKHKILDMNKRLKLVFGRQVDKLKLFHLTLYLFKDGWFAYIPIFCHALGDGPCSYMLLDNVCSFVNDEEPRFKLSWENPKIATHEILPKGYKVDPMSGLSLVMGLIVTFLRKGPKRHFEFIVLDREKVASKKEELKADDIPYLTSNDIAMAAIYQANTNAKIGVYMRTERGRPNTGFDIFDGGNILTSVYLPMQGCCDPNLLRKSQFAPWEFFAKYDYPMAATRFGKIMGCTAWASSQGKMNIVPAGYSMAFHCPNPSYTIAYIDTAIFFQMNDRCFGVMHNFAPNSMTPESRKLLDSISVKPKESS